MHPSSLVLSRRALRRLGASLCGRYSILRLIGIGGMASVYEGVHRNGHAVAIKILHEGLASDPEVERLFRREAQLANKVNHPGVVPVIDDDVAEDGCVFLVMPLLEGETLRARAERNGRKLPVEEVVVLAHELLGTLAAAHAKKIVHRDIKPENVFLTVTGDLRVLDFGIGRFFEASDSSGTRSGRAVGTPAFMAPEQALGRLREVDGQTDLWAVGAMMFSLLTARFVHEAENAAELAVLAATRHAPALAQLAPDVPEPVRRVIDRALAFKKSERWADASAMDQALLSACQAAFGKDVADLPRLSAPRTERAEDLDGAPTRVPTIARAEEADESDGPPTPTGELPHRARTPTTNGAVVHDQGSAASAHGLRRFLLPGSVLVAMAALIFAASRSTSGTPSARPAVARGAPVMSTADLFQLTTPPSIPSARPDYEAAVQLWRDGSSWDAATAFGRAAKASPDCAAAQLWFVTAANYVDADFREAYSAAVLHRGALSARQRELLDALAPSMADPSDLASTVARLTELTNRYPDDDDLRLVLAARLERLGDVSRGLELVERSLEGAAPAPLAQALRARFLLMDERTGEATSALRACIASAPTATDCLHDLIAVETNEGRCDNLQETCRTLLSRNPQSFVAYACLGDALYSTGHSVASVREAYASKYQILSNRPSLPILRAQDDIHLAIADGRLEEADRLTAAWQDLRLDVYQRTDSYIVRTRLNLELGRTEQAKKIAREFIDVSGAWPRSDFVDLDAMGLYVKSIADDLSPEDRASWRDRAARLSLDPSYGVPARRWFNVFVVSAVSRDEAQQAIDNRPARLFGPQYRDAEVDYLIGRVFALAGDSARASPFLERASRSCSLKGALYSVPATLELAKLTEDDPAAACELYGRVVERWKNTPQSLTVRAAQAARRRLACPSNQ